MGKANAVPTFEAYRPHPYLGMFPPSQEVDLQMMQASVAEVGVRQKLKLWADPQGRTYLIDGRTRQEGAERAFRDFLAARDPALPPADPVARNGLPIQPEVEYFQGTLQEVYEYVKSTHVRKHYTQGQKAAMGVRLHYHEYKQQHGSKLPTPMQEALADGGHTAVELGLQFGCNEYYIRICRQLYREAMDLLDAVAIGAVTPPKAVKALADRKAADGGTPAEDDDGSGGAVPPASGKAADDGRVLDDAGVEVPEHAQDAFRAGAVYELAGKALGRLKKDLTTLAGGPGGAYLDRAILAAQLNAVRKHLAEARPTFVCPMCGGKGKNNRWDCKRCKATGYTCGLADAAAAQAGGDDMADGDGTE